MQKKRHTHQVSGDTKADGIPRSLVLARGGVSSSPLSFVCLAPGPVQGTTLPYSRLTSHLSTLQVSKHVSELVQDMKRVMMPHTAAKLKVRR